MKKVVLLFVVLCSLPSFAQISSVVKKNNEPRISDAIDSVYPEKERFLRDHYFRLKGEELYVLPFSVDKRTHVQNSGYEGFKTIKFIPEKDAMDRKRYGNPAPNNKLNTLYSDIEGKVFIVDNVKTSYEKSRYTDKIYENAYLYLSEKGNSSNKCIYILQYVRDVPFAVMKHYYWLKENLIGKKFHFSEQYISSIDPETGKSLFCNEATVWECIDIITSPSSGYVTMLLQNPKGEKSYLKTLDYYGSINDDLDILSRLVRFSYYQDKFGIGKVVVMTDEQWQKFGAELAVHILRHKPLVGMTIEQVKLALGYPEKVNSGSELDQYIFKVFSSTYYVYIQKGVVVSWDRT